MQIAIVINLLGCAGSSDKSQRAESVSRSEAGALQVSPVKNSQGGGYIIKQGDSIDVTVWGYNEFDTKALVRQGGIISVPLIGDIKAEGLTREELTKQLKTKLSEYTQGDPKIIVSVFNSQEQKVSVIGAVLRQDNYPIAGEMPIVEMISAAGGALPESDLHHVKLIRNGSNEDPIELDLANSLENGKVDLLPKVRAGDTIFVPKKNNTLTDFTGFVRDAALIFFGVFKVFGF